MTDKSLIQLYLKDATESISAIEKDLNNIEKSMVDQGENDDTTKEDDTISNLVKSCCQNTRHLTMICWMAGKDEKEDLDFLTQLIDKYDLFFTRIFNYITRTTAKGEIIVEFLKLFEIMIRDNKTVLVNFMGKERNLSDKLQNLLNQTIHVNQEQMIRRWILKIMYIYQINKDVFTDFVNLDYNSKVKEYNKNYGRNQD